MTLRTPEEAAKVMCPVARVKPHSNVKPCCEGPKCMAWRWEPLSADDPRYKAAIQTVIRDGSGKGHQQAVAYVNANREKLGLPTGPTHGYCGLGGRP